MMWKDIQGYEGLYKVSSNGVIKSLEMVVTNQRGNYKIPEKILKLHSNPCGYLRISLLKNGKRSYYGLHRLVAEAFINNHDNLPEYTKTLEIKPEN